VGCRQAPAWGRGFVGFIEEKMADFMLKTSSKDGGLTQLFSRRGRLYVLPPFPRHGSSLQPSWHFTHRGSPGAPISSAILSAAPAVTIALSRSLCAS
jgi:hypothetical protein